MEPVAAHLELVRRLLDRADEIAMDLADEVAASAPPRWREHVDRECRPLTRALIHEAIASLETGRGLDRRSLRGVHRSAATHDPLGVPAAVTIRGVRAAVSRFVHIVREEAAALDRPRADAIAAVATLAARAPMVAFEIMAVFVSGYDAGTAVPEDARLDGLHPTAREVLRLTAQGLTTRQIASRLGCSPSNVSYHLAELRRRFDAPNRAALVANAARALGTEDPLVAVDVS